MKIISSESNPHIKTLIKLKKSRNRKLSDTFLIDGARELKIAIDSNVHIESIFVCEDFINDSKNIISEFDQNIITAVSKDIFKKVAYKENPDGFLAIAKEKIFNIKDINPKKENIVIVLESVEKPGNLGAIIRTAYAAGIKTIILTNNQTDTYNPNTIRASEGMIFKVKLIEETNINLLSWLRLNKFKIYSAATGNSKSYTDEKYSSHCSLIFGSEANGLSKFWLENCDHKIKIPMAPKIDSLNISVSVAIILFEVLRQKKDKKT
jgi:TrmH family RNA methyltransferase